MNLLVKKVFKEDKKYLEELVKPIYESNLIVNTKLEYLKEDHKKMKQESKNNIRKYLGIRFTIGLALIGTYIATNQRLDYNQEIIIQQNKDHTEKYEKQLEMTIHH